VTRKGIAHASSHTIATRLRTSSAGLDDPEPHGVHSDCPGTTGCAAAKTAGRRLGLSGWLFDLLAAQGQRKVGRAEDGDNKSLRLESRFEPFTFTWTTRHFPPQTADGVVHLNFRVRGDASGHRLHWMLGAPQPNGQGSLYYSSEQQAITLDFTGWREFSVDLDRFKTPTGGLRRRDLASVVFLECFITSQRPGVPLDVQLDDIRFTGNTPEEVARHEAEQQARTVSIADANSLLERSQARLAELQKQLDELAGQGKSVEVARVYWAAADWCRRDATRLLEAEESALVGQGKALAASLAEWLDKPERIVGRVQDRPADDGDPLRSKDNPSYQSVVASVRPWAEKEEWWSKGHSRWAIKARTRLSAAC
jgi:hypothetical protein